MSRGTIYAMLLVLVLLLAVGLTWGYEKCYFNKYLAAKHQKKTCPKKKPAGTFVGAMAQHPSLVPCAFPASRDWRMNRCNYM